MNVLSAFFCLLGLWTLGLVWVEKMLDPNRHRIIRLADLVGVFLLIYSAIDLIRYMTRQLS